MSTKLFVQKTEQKPPDTTGKKSKFPQRFYRGIGMVFKNSTVCKNPNMVILWFFEVK